MKVTRFPKHVFKKPSTLVLGSFESIHQGHLELFKLAKSFKKPVTVMIIENPSHLPVSTSEEYSSLNVRLQTLANLKIDNVITVKFDNDIRLMKGHDFIKKIKEVANANRLIFGQDFKCGIGGSYKASDIIKDFPESHIVTFKKYKDKKISTSILKEMVHFGEVDAIKKIAATPFTIDASVNSNHEFLWKNEPKLHAGIYAATAIINEILYWAYVHVSMNHRYFVTIPDLRLKNSPYEAMISFHHLTRIIVSSSKDQVTEEDVKNAANYLKNTI